MQHERILFVLHKMAVMKKIEMKLNIAPVSPHRWHVRDAHHCIFRPVLLVLLICIGTVVFAADVETTAIKTKASDLETVKRALLDWSMSVENFDIQYAIRSVLIDGDGEKFRGHWRFDYRRAGENFYFLRETFDESGASKETHILACVGGTGEFLQTHRSGDVTGTINIKAPAFPYFPWGAYITPEEILGEYMERPLRQMLSSGASSLRTKDGDLLFVHENYDLRCSVEVFFDEALRVKRIDWFFRPYELTEEELEVLWPGDPLDLRLLMTSLVFDDITEVDGVPFPATVKKIWWDSDEAPKQRLVRQRDSGEIGNAEFLVKYFSRPQFAVVVQTFNIESIGFNQPLTIADFKIAWPESAILFDAETDRQVANPNASRWRQLLSRGYCIPRLTELSVYQVSLLLSVLSLMFAVSAVAIVRLRRKSSVK